MSSDKEKYLPHLNIARTFMEENMHRKMLLQEVASAAHLSEFHFHRIFKSVTGETVKDYLMRLRLERAATQLKHSNRDVGTIAFENGFDNHETFTRAFKRDFGITPSDYRANAKELTAVKRETYTEKAIRLADLGVEEPVIKQLPDLRLVYVRHFGSYDKVAASFQRLMLWALKHLALKLKPTTIGIVHDDPELTTEDKIRYDACVLVNKPVRPSEAIGYKEIEGGKFAVFRYKGPFDGFHAVYDYIYHVCLFEKGWELADKPALEWYIQSPPFYKPSNYLTDFYVPIK